MRIEITMCDTLKKTILEQLSSAENILLMTHLRPDGDALGSTCGMRSFLRARGIAADVLAPGGIPQRYRKLCPDLLTAENCAPDRYDLFVALDCANPQRLGTLENLPVELLRTKNFISIDHHFANSLAAPLEWIAPDAGSTCQMVANLLLFSGEKISAECATLLMTGIKTDTGNFSFSNTRAETFYIAGKLMECGADVDRIANEVFFSKPLNQLHFESALVSEQLRTVCDGKIAYAFVPEEMLKKYDFEMKEDEGLIDILRQLDKVVIAMLVHKRADGFRISLRSKDPAHPVGPVARALGGGGHDMAAGTTLDLPEFSDVEKIILPMLSELLK